MSIQAPAFTRFGHVTLCACIIYTDEIIWYDGPAILALQHEHIEHTIYTALQNNKKCRILLYKFVACGFLALCLPFYKETFAHLCFRFNFHAA